MTVENILSEETTHTAASRGSYGTPMSIAKFTDQFGADLHLQVNHIIGHKFDPLYKMPKKWVEIIEKIQRHLLAGQLYSVFSLMDGFLNHGERGLFMDGKPGTGKTTIATSVIWMLSELGHGKRFMVVCPPHLVKKWQREITEMLRHHVKIVMLNDSGALSKLQSLPKLNTDKPIIAITSSGRIRDGAIWVPKLKVNSRTDSLHCTSCYAACNLLHERRLHPLTMADVKRHGSDCLDENSRIVRRSKSNHQAMLPLRQKTFCHKCGSARWEMRRASYRSTENKILDLFALLGMKNAAQSKILGDYTPAEILTEASKSPLSFTRDLARAGYIQTPAADEDEILAITNHESYPLSEFIRRKLKGFFDLVVIDECHEYKNASGRGAAARDICSRSKRVLSMSGTITSGYSDDLPLLIGMTAPNILLDGGYSPGERVPLGFTRDFGAIRVQEKYTQHRSLPTKTAIMKQPGISPKAPLDLLVPYTTYLTMQDVSENYEPLQDIILVNMGKKLLHAYRDLEAKALSWGKQNPRTSAQVVKALMAYTSTCWLPADIRHPETDEILWFAPGVHDKIDEKTPKEEAIINLCRQNMAEQRKVLLYTNHITRRPQMDRYIRLLSEDGFNVKGLNASTIQSKQRENWLMHETSDIDVLVTNPEIVKTGLDLLSFTTIIFADVGQDAFTVQQALSRSLRLNQEEKVRIFFVCYKHCLEERMTRLLAEKLQCMLSFGGQVPETGFDSLIGNPYVDVLNDIK